MQKKIENSVFSVEKDCSETTLFGSSTAETLLSLKSRLINSSSESSMVSEEKCNLDDMDETSQSVPSK